MSASLAQGGINDGATTPKGTWSSEKIEQEINAVSGAYAYREECIDYVDNTQAPPTEVTGDRYILDDTGASNPAWDGVPALSIAEFDGATWQAITPESGWRCYVANEGQDRAYIDDGSPAWEARPAFGPHALGGTDHTADTLANLNSKVTDATLDDSSASRPAQAHDLAGAEHNADTLADLNTKVSDASLVALAGQIGGSSASPDIRGIRETGGPTLLTVGAIADGQGLKRSGSNLVGYEPYPPGHLDGGALSRNATNPTYQIDIAAGSCKSDDDTTDILWSSTLTFDVSTTGANGRNSDTAEQASKWYLVHVIWNPTTGTAAAFGINEDDIGSFTWPSGYTKKRLLGAFRNDASSNFSPLTQSKTEGRVREFHWDESEESALEVLTAGSATTWTDVDLSALVPPTTTWALIRVMIYGTNAPSGCCKIRPNGSSLFFPSTRQHAGTNLVEYATSNSRWLQRTDDNQIIEYDNVYSGDDSYIWVEGFILVL